MSPVINIQLKHNTTFMQLKRKNNVVKFILKVKKMEEKFIDCKKLSVSDIKPILARTKQGSLLSVFLCICSFVCFLSFNSPVGDRSKALSQALYVSLYLIIEKKTFAHTSRPL